VLTEASPILASARWQHGRYVLFDRPDKVHELMRGKFASLTSLEAVYSTSPLVRQIFLSDDNAMSRLLAVIVPAPIALAEYGNSSALKTALCQSLRERAATAGLDSSEVPVDILIEPEPFDDEHRPLSVQASSCAPVLKERCYVRLDQISGEIAPIAERVIGSGTERRER
jgi:fatty acid CoA ligase FadD9